MGDINDFEVYNFGHMFTAACVHKKNYRQGQLFLQLQPEQQIIWSICMKRQKHRRGSDCSLPSHYMGLVEMYRTTGEERYLKLAKQAIALRDSVKEWLG